MNHLVDCNECEKSIRLELANVKVIRLKDNHYISEDEAMKTLDDIQYIYTCTECVNN